MGGDYHNEAKRKIEQWNETAKLNQFTTNFESFHAQVCDVSF
jgi:hypothetical protein